MEAECAALPRWRQLRRQPEIGDHGDALIITSRRAWAAVVVIGLVLVACSRPGASVAPSQAGKYPGWPGSGTVVAKGDFVPVLVSGELGAGHTRILITLQDGDGRSLATPDLTVEERFYDLAESTETPVGEATGTFRWLIPDTKAI